MHAYRRPKGVINILYFVYIEKVNGSRRVHVFFRDVALSDCIRVYVIISSIIGLYDF